MLYITLYTTTTMSPGSFILIEATQCNNNATAQTISQGSSLSSGTYSNGTLTSVGFAKILRNLTLFQSYSLSVPTCNDMLVQVRAFLTDNTPVQDSILCNSWSQSGVPSDLSISDIPQTVQQSTITIRDQSLDTLADVGQEISGAMSNAFTGAVTSVESVYTNLQAEAFSVYSNTQSQIDAQEQARLAVIAADIATIQDSTNNELELLKLIESAAAVTMPTLDQILAYQNFLIKENAQVEVILGELANLEPLFDAAANNAFNVTQSLINANDLIITAPQNFNWSDVSDYIFLLSNLVPCPATWTPPDLYDVECNVNPINPYSWIVDGLSCINGYNYGWRILLIVFFFNLVTILIVIIIIFEIPCGPTCKRLQSEWLKRPGNSVRFVFNCNLFIYFIFFWFLCV